MAFILVKLQLRQAGQWVNVRVREYVRVRVRCVCACQ